MISGGEAHFTGKGFTIDAKTKEEYFRLLGDIDNISPVSDDMKEVARKYAYSYFVQRQIPLKVINKEEGHFGNLDIKKLDRLLPGNDPVIDAVCNSIIEGKDVILDAETADKAGLEL